MQPYLIHIHVFHTAFVQELCDALAVLGEQPYDLYFTMGVQDADLQESLQRRFPAAHFIPVGNRGYDVYPFLRVLAEADLTRYSYCIKLHTKRDVQDSISGAWGDVSGPRWREYLLSFMQPAHFARCTAAMAAQPQLGMVGHYRLIFRKEPTQYGFPPAVEQLLQRAGLPLREYRFIAGTMFLCRAALLEPLKKLALREEDFAPAGSGTADESSLAHVLERFMGCMITAQGYTVEDCYTPAARRVWEGLTRRLPLMLWRFLYQNKVTRKGRRIIKICKIPVCVRRVS